MSNLVPTVQASATATGPIPGEFNPDAPFGSIEGAVPLGDGDQILLGEAEEALANGLALKQWWEGADANHAYAESFELVRTFNRPDRGLAFFDRVPLAGGILPVMGLVQEMTYDLPKCATPRMVRDQLREFVLHYFLRVSDYRDPEPVTQGADRLATGREPWPSWCFSEQDRSIGFGFSQVLYKRAGTGAVGKFPERDRYAIVDLRQLGPIYEWVLGKVQLFDFHLRFRPFGADAVGLDIPLTEANYLVFHPDFVLNRDDPEPGVLGRYGLGYALIRHVDRETVFGYGPGLFTAGFQLIRFDVLASGETRARMAFVVNRPERVLNVPLNPVRWGVRLADLASLGLASRLLGIVRPWLDRMAAPALGVDPVAAYIVLLNLATGGLAGEEWCVSMRQLEEDFLLHHFMQHYQLLIGSHLTWRSIPDWLDVEALPRWVITGVSS